MKKIEIELYTIEEIRAIDEKLFQKLHNEYISNSVEDSALYFTNQELYASLKKFLELCNINVNQFSIDFSDRRYSSIHLKDTVENLTGLRAFKWIENNIVVALKKGKFYHLYTIGTMNNRTKHSKCMFEIDNCPLTGMCYDNIVSDIVKAMRKMSYRHLQNFTVENFVVDVITECFNYYEREEKCYYSEEYFIEECSNNEIMYTKDGKQF